MTLWIVLIVLAVVVNGVLFWRVAQRDREDR